MQITCWRLWEHNENKAKKGCPAEDEKITNKELFKPPHMVYGVTSEYSIYIDAYIYVYITPWEL